MFLVTLSVRALKLISRAREALLIEILALHQMVRALNKKHPRSMLVRCAGFREAQVKGRNPLVRTYWQLPRYQLPEPPTVGQLPNLYNIDEKGYCVRTLLPVLH